MASKQSSSSKSNPAKRKDPPSQRARDPKRRKMFSAPGRNLPVQSSDEAFSNGQLDVAKFVKAREFEIRALEDGIKQAAKGLASRAFQEVPRELRRRTASHNVKRVPKRLQARAKREMIQDNTPVRKKKRILPQQRLRIETVRRMESVKKRLQTKKAEKKAKRIASLENEVTITEDNEENGASAALVKVRKPKVKTSVLRSPPTPRAKFRKRQLEKTWLPSHLYHNKRARMTPPKQPLWRFALPLTPSEKSYRKTHRASSLRNAIAWDTSYMSTIRLHGVDKSLEGLLKAIGVGSGDKPAVLWTPKGAKWKRGLRSWSGWVFKRDSDTEHPICPVTIIWNSEASKNQESKQSDGPDRAPKLRELMVRCHPSAFLELWTEVTNLAKVQKPAVKVEDLRFELGSIEITGPSSTEALVSILHPINNEENESTIGLLQKLKILTNPNMLPKNVVLSMKISDPRLHSPLKHAPEGHVQSKQEELLQVCHQWPLDKNASPIVLFDKNTRTLATKSLQTQKSINRRKAQAKPGENPLPQKGDAKIPILLFTTNSGTGNQGAWTLMMPWKCVLPVWYTLMHHPVSTGGTIRFGGINEQRQIAYESGRPWFPADYPGTKAGMEWELREREDVKAAWDRKPKGRRTEFDSLNLGHEKRGEIGLGWSCDWDALQKSKPFHQASFLRAQALLKDNNDPTFQPSSALYNVKITMITKGAPQARARIYRLPNSNPKDRSLWLSFLDHQGPKKNQRSLPKPGDHLYPGTPQDSDLLGRKRYCARVNLECQN
ncbi:POPLD-domain-containing protein [Microthyrium microscopicum]|uniref:POPLD-domain-containing protein n=1 Tax=Microthyrium microscopicum TaxID=703497 RepID=A0A6A6UD52_9PEZI|nr:POPLD-domain-containing protein [Microthyrium microscopicum]